MSGGFLYLTFEYNKHQQHVHEEEMMGISASHFGALCADAEHEARELYPGDARAQRRYISKRLGILTREDLDDEHAEVATISASWENWRKRTENGSVWKRALWKLYYFFK